MDKAEALRMFEGHLQMLKDGDLHYLVEGRKTNQMQMYEIAIECIKRMFKGRGLIPRPFLFVFTWHIYFHGYAAVRATVCTDYTLAVHSEILVVKVSAPYQRCTAYSAYPLHTPSLIRHHDVGKLRERNLLYSLEFFKVFYPAMIHDFNIIIMFYQPKLKH